MTLLIGSLRGMFGARLMAAFIFSVFMGLCALFTDRISKFENADWRLMLKKPISRRLTIDAGHLPWMKSGPLHAGAC